MKLKGMTEKKSRAKQQRLKNLDASDLATVLAALRMFQQRYKECDGDTIAKDWPEHFTQPNGTLLPPLSTEDIDELCERLNMS